MVTFDGTALEVEAIRLWRQGEDPDDISRATRISGGDLLDLMRRYLAYRRARLNDPLECKNIRDSEIDQLDALIETYLPAALRGDIRAATFVVNARKAKAVLEAGYHQFDRERLGEQARNLPDNARRLEGMTPSQIRQQRLREAEANGIEVDPAARIAGELIHAAG
jgi:hypothetical protein